MNIKFSNMDVAGMIEYLKDADIKEATVVELTEDKIICRAHPSSKSIVKYTSKDIADLFKYDATPADMKTIKVPLFRLTKLVDALKVYEKTGVEKVSGTINCSPADDGSHTANYINLVDKKGTKIRVKATELYLIPYMPEEIWDKISSTDNHFAKFDMSKDFVDKLSNLIGLKVGDAGENEKSKTKTKSFAVKFGKDGDITFFSQEKDDWSMKYEESDGNKHLEIENDLAIKVPKLLVEIMNGQLYTVYVVMNKIVNQYMMVTVLDEENIILNALQPYDPNKPE